METVEINLDSFTKEELSYMIASMNKSNLTFSKWVEAALRESLESEEHPLGKEWRDVPFTKIYDGPPLWLD
jgi:hypothetical protein